MNDYIKREDAIKDLDMCFDDIPMDQTTEILKLRRLLRTMPPADVIELGKNYFAEEYFITVHYGDEGQIEWFRIDKKID